MKYSSTPLIFAVGIFLNVTGYFLIEVFKIYVDNYFFLDATGTILAGVVLGPLMGGITGLVSNLIFGIVFSPVNIPFAIVNLIIGVTAGIIAKKMGFKGARVLITATVIIAVITSLSSAVVAYFFFGGATGLKIDLNIISLINMGLNSIFSSFLVRLPVNLLDKGISIIIVIILLSFTSKKIDSKNE